MREPLALDLPAEARRILEVVAHAGVLGSTQEEVAAYLILRELDDMMRTGALKLG